MNINDKKLISRRWLPIIWLISAGAEVVVLKAPTTEIGVLAFAVGLLIYFTIYYFAK